MLSNYRLHYLVSYANIYEAVQLQRVCSIEQDLTEVLVFEKYRSNPNLFEGRSTILILVWTANCEA
jgi:hypothetical protein